MRWLRIVRSETHYELLKLIRLPGYLIATLVFPLMFYAIFGLAFYGSKQVGGTRVAAYMMATMSTFGVVGASLFGLGVGLAMERAQGWLMVKRATPMPVSAYFIAKVAIAMIFSAVITASMFVLGAAAGHVRLEAQQWMALWIALVLGAAPFCALGMAVSYSVGPNSAQAVVNLLYLPMAFASGLWMPIETLPHWVSRIAPYLPPYHLARLALGTIGADASATGPHLAALAGFTLFFLVLALAGFQRDEGRTYG